MNKVMIELSGVCKHYAATRVGFLGWRKLNGRRTTDDGRQTTGNGNGNQHNGHLDLGPAAVRELSLEVRKGEVLALLGPSGCGKTTTVRLIAGLETPDHGEVWLDGRQVAGGGIHIPPEKRHVGMVFQDYALFPHLTVSRNIGFPINKWPAPKREERVRELLDLVGLSGLGDRYPHQLSGGQQQRVALARALAPEPAVVLLDEPFSNLDADSRASVRAEVRQILRRLGTTAVFVTHDQEEAFFMGDRVAVMSTGRVEQVGTPEEIFGAPGTRFVAEFLGLPTFIPATVTEDGLATEVGLQAQTVVAASLGTAVEVLVRPDDLSLRYDPEGRARIVRTNFRGMDYLYDVALPSGQLVQCLGVHTARYEPGTRVRVDLTPGHTLVCFPREQECPLECCANEPSPAAH